MSMEKVLNELEERIRRRTMDVKRKTRDAEMNLEMLKNIHRKIREGNNQTLFTRWEVFTLVSTHADWRIKELGVMKWIWFFGGVIATTLAFLAVAA